MVKMEMENKADSVAVGVRLAGILSSHRGRVSEIFREIYTGIASVVRTIVGFAGWAGGAARDWSSGAPGRLSGAQLTQRDDVRRSIRGRIVDVNLEWRAYRLYQKQSKDELRIIANMFSNRLSQLSFDAQVMMFMGDTQHTKKLRLVKWALLEYHPDQYRLQVDSLTL